MPIYNVKLMRKDIVAHSTMAIHLAKPKGFEFKAGQFGDITLLDPPETDEEGNIRGFSLAHAPYEADLMMATRLRDTAFKRVLRALPIGAEVKLDAPYGSFTLHNNERTPAVFLTGGIGITPVRSIIAQATHDKTAHRITLLYANKTPADAAFMADLESYAKANSNFTFVPVMDEAPGGWRGERGLINASMLARHVSDLKAPIYYLCGPAAMVAAMRKLLDEAGVDEDNTRTEEFSGY
ncbi:MAG: FAD-dependent oxidoreductase [Burkholderiales bacterium]|nr:FAD-dependent oxidoreductase [Burkholderiales bacterium]